MTIKEKNSRAFRSDLAKATYKDHQKSFERNLPVTVKEVEKLHPTSVLKEYILKWPPRDVRYDESISSRVQSRGADSLFMRHMFEGMDLEILKVQPTENMVTVGIFFQTNLSEFERYNIATYHHNLKWIDNGMKEEVFDPVHGEIVPVTDQFVDYARADSKYISRPDRNPFGTKSSGTLSKMRPDVKRKPVLVASYKLEVIDRAFRLGYVVKDYRGRVIYFNEIKGDNLSDLTRRATQEIFGHPFIYADQGPFLDGIPLLIQGKKLKICRRDNIAPDWMQGPLKTSNFSLYLSKGVKGINIFYGMFFSFLLPFFLLVRGILWHPFTLMVDKGPLYFFSRMLLTLVAMYFSVKLGYWFKKKAFDVSLQEKFL